MASVRRVLSFRPEAALDFDFAIFQIQEVSARGLAPASRMKTVCRSISYTTPKRDRTHARSFYIQHIRIVNFRKIFGKSKGSVCFFRESPSETCLPSHFRFPLKIQFSGIWWRRFALVIPGGACSHSNFLDRGSLEVSFYSF